MELGKEPALADTTPVTTRNLDDAEIERVLQANGGNVTAAARELGLHRNQLRRWIEKRGQKTPPPE